MDRIRILLLAPDCHPGQVSIPYVAYCHAAALAKIHDVTLVAGTRVEAPLRQANAQFQKVEIVRTPLLDRIYAWCVRRAFKNNYDSQALTAFGYPFSLAFEWGAWRQLRRRIFAGDFDVVLRLLPMTPVLPSPFAFFLREGPIPFVLGPLNGGLRSAQGFSQPDKERTWVWRLRRLHRYVPFASSTYRNAAAIILASWHMETQFRQYGEKLFFVPENGIAQDACAGDLRRTVSGARLELIFVGGLVRRKACYIGLRAAAPLLRTGAAHFSIVGDGPERTRLEDLARSLGVETAVTFRGWLSHSDVLKNLRSADIVILPALREGGGGVVFEGLASGAVPVILDHGGPGDIVHEAVGFKVAPTNEAEVISQMTAILTGLAADTQRLNRLREQGAAYARACLTWDAKARRTTRVLNWVLHRGPKPDLRPATMAEPEPRS